MGLISVTDPVERVRRCLEKAGYTLPLRHIEETIFTVDEAAEAVGVPPCQILKSLLFAVDDGAAMVLVLMSGSNRVNDKKVKKFLGARKVRMATEEAIYEFCGFRPGGIPPVGYSNQPMTLMDEDIFAYDLLWAAAGTDHDLFSISPEELIRLTVGKRIDVKIGRAHV